METTAKDFNFAIMAGLTLCGAEEGEPQWIGDQQAWRRYRNFRDMDDKGLFDIYPWQEKTPF